VANIATNAITAKNSLFIEEFSNIYAYIAPTFFDAPLPTPAAIYSASQKYVLSKSTKCNQPARSDLLKCLLAGSGRIF
jgi:hypothetical protein